MTLTTASALQLTDKSCQSSLCRPLTHGYYNFKSSIADDKEGDRRHNTYMGVWSTMLRYQKSEQALETKPKKGKKKA